MDSSVVEHLILDQAVAGSIPVHTKSMLVCALCFLFDEQSFVLPDFSIVVLF